jgi:hypothetical protein
MLTGNKLTTPATAQRFIASLVEAMGVLIVDRSSIPSSCFVAHPSPKPQYASLPIEKDNPAPQTTAGKYHRQG